MPLPEQRVLEHNGNRDDGAGSAQPLGVELPPAIRADLLDPANLARNASPVSLEFADGSVHFLGQNIDHRTYQYLGCRNDGQAVGDY